MPTTAPRPRAAAGPGDPQVHTVPCRDAIDRERAIHITHAAGEVMVIAPPGETARLTPPQLDELRMALDAAERDAKRAAARAPQTVASATLAG